MMKKRIILVLVTVALCFVMPAAAYAGTGFDLRKKTVNLTGIVRTNVITSSFVSRAEFARMLVMASSSSDILSSACSSNVYADVPASSEYAQAIKICADNNWMRGYLGGEFRPEQAVTLNDAERALLMLLGYTDKDFEGDVVGRRSAKADALALTENVSRALTEELTYADCINLFYNLMRCSTLQGKAYVTVLGGSLSSDGEVNLLGMTDNSLKGPRYFDRVSELELWLPFDKSASSVFIDGEAGSWSRLADEILSGMAVYYSSKAKTVWAYTVDGNIRESGKGAVKGTITNVLYQSADTLTPSGVEIDGIQFNLDSSEMQFAFSVYGSCRVGETVTVIYNVTRGAANPSVLDYIYE